MARKNEESKFDLEIILSSNVDIKNRRIYFGNLHGNDDDADDKNSFTWSTVEVIVRAIHKLATDDPKKPIELHISSDGGSVMQMFRLVDVIEQTPCKIIFIGSGTIYSAAAYLMLACDERIVTRNCGIMLHEMHCGISGTHVERKIDYELAEKDQDRLNNLVVENSRMPLEFWKDVLQRDLYLTPEEAQMLGIVDKIIEPLKRGNLRKSRIASLQKMPDKKELLKLTKALYNRVNKGSKIANLELHIPEEKFDPEVAEVVEIQLTLAEGEDDQ